MQGQNEACGIPRTSKFKVELSVGKVMDTASWIQKDVLLVDFLERGATINVYKLPSDIATLSC